MGMRGDGIKVYLRLSRTYFRYTTLIYKFTDKVSEEAGEDFFPTSKRETGSFPLTKLLVDTA